jgi:hypothetical protein
LLFRTTTNISTDAEEDCEDEEEYPLPPPIRSPSVNSQPSCSSSCSSSKLIKRSDKEKNDFESTVKAYLISKSQPTQEEDEDLLFFKSLLPLLKKLPSSEKEEVKGQIHSLVARAVYPPQNTYSPSLYYNHMLPNPNVLLNANVYPGPNVPTNFTNL